VRCAEFGPLGPYLVRSLPTPLARVVADGGRRSWLELADGVAARSGLILFVDLEVRMAPSAAVKESVFTTAVRAVADSKSYRDQAALVAIKVMAARICFASGLSKGLIGADQLSQRSAPVTAPQRSTSSAASNGNRQPHPGPQSFPGLGPWSIKSPRPGQPIRGDK
jgi:hypothetical protein